MLMIGSRWTRGAIGVALLLSTNFCASAAAATALQCGRALPELSADAPPQGATASFGLRESGGAFIVDTGADLVFSVRRSGPRGLAKGAGDLFSIRYHGVEYQDPDKGSQVNSGFGGLYDSQLPVVVLASRVDDDHIRLEVQAGGLTHYYLAVRGVPTIFMGTVFDTEPRLGLVRFIARLRRDVLPDGPPCADLNGADHIVEAHDVFGFANGETRSKHYSNMRLGDWRYFGARGPRAAAWVVRDDQEGGSGGPFYRSLIDQGTAADQELTYIVNYGEAQTELFRTGVLDAYALAFTDGAPPAPLDTTWYGRMGLKGWAGPEERDAVRGAGLIGMRADHGYTIGFANARAQYWTHALPGSGAYERDAMRPGRYRMTVYKDELAVAAVDVSVAARILSKISAVSLLDDPEQQTAIWRIGRWDGMPLEFLNGDKVTWMHPSDRRMSDWRTVPFLVGRSPTNSFPAYLWADVNSPIQILFSLPAGQPSAATLRIGITVAYANARPDVRVNGWQAAAQAPTSQPSSRSLTIGSYRGSNAVVTIAVPATALHPGWNTLDIKIASGKQGRGFLSPGFAFDAVDLIPAAASKRDQLSDEGRRGQ